MEKLSGKRAPDKEVQRTLANLKARGVDPESPSVRSHLDQVLARHFPELLPPHKRPRRPS